MRRFLFILLWLGCACGGGLHAQLPVIMDMVHHNPGEPFTESKFNEPATLARYGYSAQVVNEFQSVHTAITYDGLDERICPPGSKERLWADSVADRIRHRIEAIHQAGLEAYYFTDIIVFPKRLVEIFRDEICDADGNIDFMRPKTQEIHRMMLREVFERFPALDGLVIRVGETYLHNTPYHTGNGPVLKGKNSAKRDAPYKTDGGEEVHRSLMNLLREEVCVRLNKKVFYRTWDFGYFHTTPQYYLNVTDGVEPHPNLYICVKHVRGDYFRTYKFNPTLGIGRHKQVVEIECQREYEGKGAYPNYIADGVLNGFEELKSDASPYCMNQLKVNPLLAGIWTWSRGGGWRGPYLKNELWCEANVAVLAGWARDTSLTERELFASYAADNGFEGEDIGRFHRLALLSADAIVRGRYSLVKPVKVLWTRDQFIGGTEALKVNLETILKSGLTDRVMAEKRESVALWEKIVALADSIQTGRPDLRSYLRTSSRYGLLLYSIYEQGWTIMLKGYEGDKSGKYDIQTLEKAIARYDRLWEEYLAFVQTQADCATAYEPYAFNFRNPPSYRNPKAGLKPTVDKYRKIIGK